MEMQRIFQRPQGNGLDRLLVMSHKRIREISNLNVFPFYDRKPSLQKCSKEVAELIVGGPRDDRAEPKNSLHAFETARHLENSCELLKQKCRGHVILRLQYFLFHRASFKQNIIKKKEAET